MAYLSRISNPASLQVEPFAKYNLIVPNRASVRDDFCIVCPVGNEIESLPNEKATANHEIDPSDPGRCGIGNDTSDGLRRFR
jgi:hypothetical protein